MFVPYNATFSHCTPTLGESLDSVPQEKCPRLRLASLLAFGKGTEPPGNEIAANTTSLKSLSEAIEQDKRDSFPSSCLGRGLG